MEYSNDYLCHYGVLGMKWGQHLFGKDRASGSSNSKSINQTIIYGPATFETAAVNNLRRLKKAKTSHTDLTAAPKKKASAYNFESYDGSTIFSGTKAGRKRAWQKQNAEMFARALQTTDGRNNKNLTEVDAGRKIMSDSKRWYNDDIKTSYKNLDNVNARYTITKTTHDKIQSAAYRNPTNANIQAKYQKWSKLYSEVHKEREAAIDKEVKRLFGTEYDGERFGGFYDSTGNEYRSYDISDLAKDMLRHPSDMGYTSEYMHK